MDKFKKEQLRLSKKVIKKDDFDRLEIIGGVNIANSEKKIVACVVVCDKKLVVVEKSFVEKKPLMKYMPGFLSYREAPAIIEAFSQLEKKPDLLIVRGHGINHPRKLGIASHLGLLLDIPTVGVAEKLLCGEVVEGKIMIDEEIRGAEVFTKEKANPIYVSIGHRVCLKTAIEVVKKMIKEPHKTPEPLFLAHKSAKKQLNSIL